MTDLQITPHEFQQLRQIVYAHCGINLTDQKRQLVISRLRKVLIENRLPDFRSYLTWLQDDRSGSRLSQMIDRISTNHTAFFREKPHFDLLSQTILPALRVDLERRKEPDLRIWCAGCSSGEEAYTLMMVLRESFDPSILSASPGLLATDISTTVLNHARSGVYSPDRVSGVPDLWKRRYLRRSKQGLYEVDGRLREAITFRRFNLMTERFPFRKPFQIIFCRNVMIYFDQPTRQALFGKFRRSLIPGGYLFIGHSETMDRNEDGFVQVRPAVFRKRA